MTSQMRDPALVAAVVCLSLIGGIIGGIGALIGVTGGIVVGALTLGGVALGSLAFANRRTETTK